MPNLNPVPDSPAHLAPELEAIARDALVRVHPYGALTVGEQERRWQTWRAWLLMWWPSLMTAGECSPSP